VVWRLLTRRYDALHVHFVIPTGLLAWLATRLRPAPYIVTAHGSDIPGYNPDRFNKEHGFTTPLLRRILGGAFAITAPSEFLGGLIREHCGEFKIDHLPNGLFSNQLAPAHKEDIVLLTGRLLRRKGFHTVLEALRGVDTSYEVHIVGDGPERTALESLADELSVKVVFHGWLPNGAPELQSLYERARIFCLPSSRENASISLLEGMLAGAAVITSNVSGCPETIGEAGVTVAPEDPAALRAVLLPLMGDPEACAALGAKARARVLSHFDWEIIADQYLELLERAAASTLRAR
jgi:glycosyltransferase involved in cell wall biosynthesis